MSNVAVEDLMAPIGDGLDCAWVLTSAALVVIMQVCSAPSAMKRSYERLIVALPGPPSPASPAGHFLTSLIRTSYART